MYTVYISLTRKKDADRCSANRHNETHWREGSWFEKKLALACVLYLTRAIARLALKAMWKSARYVHEREHNSANRSPPVHTYSAHTRVRDTKRIYIDERYPRVYVRNRFCVCIYQISEKKRTFIIEASG